MASNQVVGGSTKNHMNVVFGQRQLARTRVGPMDQAHILPAAPISQRLTAATCLRSRVVAGGFVGHSWPHPTDCGSLSYGEAIHTHARRHATAGRAIMKVAIAASNPGVVVKPSFGVSSTGRGRPRRRSRPPHHTIPDPDKV